MGALTLVGASPRSGVVFSPWLGAGFLDRTPIGLARRVKQVVMVAYLARSGVIWTQQAKLTVADAGSGDQFGGAVSLDGSTLLVGARYEDEKG
ncbi:MAG TPA: hypothetical protein EYP90_08680, partial [Chromatiaceae bacterium]|nr:hypothetical protein [Chromatiaceae bacterium]